MTDFTQRAIDDFIAELEDFLEERSGVDRRHASKAKVLDLVTHEEKRSAADRRQGPAQNLTLAATAESANKARNTF